MLRLLQQLTAAPHRPLFLLGALQLVVTMTWWLAVLLGRQVGVDLEPAVPAGVGHASLMLYGLFPGFVFGFLFTAMPNWLETGPVPRARYLATASALAPGTLALLPALYWPWLTLPAMFALLAGWAIALLALLDRLRASTLKDTLHARLAWLATLLGGLGALALSAWLAGAPAWTLDLAWTLGIWGFLTPLFTVVCHRMIPFFSARVLPNYVMIRPNRALVLLVAGCLAHGLLTLAGLPEWTWPVDLPTAALALWLGTRWGLARTLGNRLLAMLHIGFVWVPIAFALFAFDSLARGFDGGLGLAPLHALGIGFFGSLLVGMASRVSLGHSGRKLEADNFTWSLFWLLQVAALARLPTELAGAPDGLIVVSAALWLAVFVPWVARHAPWYWRPRADGKPG